jgi:hypothetical protein
MHISDLKCAGLGAHGVVVVSPQASRAWRWIVSRAPSRMCSCPCARPLPSADRFLIFASGEKSDRGVAPHGTGCASKRDWYICNLVCKSSASRLLQQGSGQSLALPLSRLVHRLCTVYTSIQGFAAMRARLSSSGRWRPFS